MSETLKHIQEINSHLGKLAKEAPGLSLDQLKKQYHHHQQQQQRQKRSIKAVVSDPGSCLLKVDYTVHVYVCLILIFLVLIPMVPISIF
jgi:hypothetical protein